MATVKELTEELATAETRIEELEAQVSDLEGQVSTLTTSLNEALAKVPEDGKTTTVYEEDGTPNVQTLYTDKEGNTHHYGAS